MLLPCIRCKNNLIASPCEVVPFRGPNWDMSVNSEHSSFVIYTSTSHTILIKILTNVSNIINVTRHAQNFENFGNSEMTNEDLQRLPTRLKNNL